VSFFLAGRTIPPRSDRLFWLFGGLFPFNQSLEFPNPLAFPPIQFGMAGRVETHGAMTSIFPDPGNALIRAEGTVAEHDVALTDVRDHALRARESWRLLPVTWPSQQPLLRLTSPTISITGKPHPGLAAVSAGATFRSS